MSRQSPPHFNHNLTSGNRHYPLVLYIDSPLPPLTAAPFFDRKTNSPTFDMADTTIATTMQVASDTPDASAAAAAGVAGAGAPPASLALRTLCSMPLFWI